MIYKKMKTGDTEELKEVSFEEAFPLASTDELAFDSADEEVEFYKQVVKKHPPVSIKVHKADKSPISGLLLYLKDEDLHEIALSIINGEYSEKYENLDYKELLFYLNESDIEMLFFKALSEENQTLDVKAIAPYASEATYTKFVDEYIAGKYQEINIDTMYSYMKSRDIKRLFEYYLAKKTSLS